MGVLVPKKYTGIRKGISTEAPLTEWPEGFLMDCVNFDVLPDGSFKRRYGLKTETLVTNLRQDVYVPELVSNTFLWENASNQTYTIVVCQVGHMLFFSADVYIGAVISYGERLTYEVDLYSFMSPAYASENSLAAKLRIAKEPCSFSSGMGRLYITHKYCEPVVVDFNKDTWEFQVSELVIKERDYLGVKDDVPIDMQPTLAELQDMGAEDSHRYNLFNRGWSQTNIDQYVSDKGKYPAKNMLMGYGYRKYDDISTNTKSYAPDEGIKEFSSDKLANELFGQASAPQGHLICKVWDTTKIWSGIGSGDYTTAPIENATMVNITSKSFEITCTATGHGLTVNDETYINNMVLVFKVTNRFIPFFKKTLAEVVTVTSVPDANTFKFTVTVTDVKLEADSVATFGTYTSPDPVISNTEYGEILSTRFRVNAFFQGRLWLAGLDEGRALNRIYFSKVIEHPTQLGDCLTEADPTDLRISDPIPTDGGYITIKELGVVKALVPYGNSMLVMSSEGIWQIGPGSLGYFSPVSYSIRRITNQGLIGSQAWCLAEKTPIYWGKDAIYTITEDTNSGYLTAVDISSDKINRLFTQINPKGKEAAIAVYDDLDKRVFFLYGGLDKTSSELDGSIFFQKIGPTAVDSNTGYNDWTYRNHMLVLDLRTGGYTRREMSTLAYTNTYIYNIGCFVFPNKYTTDRKYKLNVLGFQPANGTQFSSNTIYWRQFSDASTYKDGDSYTDAYIIAGPEALGWAGPFKQAPYVNCYFRRIDGSSCLLQPVWDWSKSTVTGNVGNPQQVYREVTPRADGNKMIATRNRVLGRGRSLYLGFHTLPGKPCWIEGWDIQYNAERKV